MFFDEWVFSTGPVFSSLCFVAHSTLGSVNCTFKSLILTVGAVNNLEVLLKCQTFLSSASKLCIIQENGLYSVLLSV